MQFKIRLFPIVNILLFVFTTVCFIGSASGNQPVVKATHQFVKSKHAAAKIEYNRSADMEIGFFESLDLTADLIMKNTDIAENKSSNASRKNEAKPTEELSGASRSDKSVNTNAAVEQSGSASINQLAATNSTSLHSQEKTAMWLYLLFLMVTVVFTLLVLVLLRIYKNTRIVESPNNIIQEIKALAVDIEAQNKAIREVRFRIQKTENSFINVLGHQIEDKYNELIKDVDMQFQEFASSQKSASQQSAELNHRVGEIENLLHALKEFVADQKAEIRRLHQGYDWSVINHISVGMINVVDKIDRELEKGVAKEEKQSLDEIREEITAILESYNIKKSTPKVGSEYTDQEGDKNCKVVMIDSDEPRLRGKIARVIKPSYVYRMSKDKKRVIREAEIEVYS